MSRLGLVSLLVILIVALSACGSTSAVSKSPSADSYNSPNLDLGYENALPARMQFLLGTLMLAETKTSVTAEQAKVFLPLWQALQSMTSSGNSATEEVNALLGQIEAIFTPEQLAAVKEWKLTFADMNSWAAANGITLGSGSGQPGQGQGMSPEARATRQAENGKAGGGTSSGASAALTRAVIAYLEKVK